MEREPNEKSNSAGLMSKQGTVDMVTLVFLLMEFIN